MQLLAFTDLHGNRRALVTVQRRARTASILACTGDLTVFGHDMKELLEELDRIGKPVLMLHGNHEDEDELKAACAQCKNIFFLHLQRADVNDWHFLAYGGGGFSERYEDFEEWMRAPAWRKIDWSRTIVLSHAPPYGTKLDDVGEPGEPWHVGSKSLRKLIQQREPLLTIAGHIHEAFRTEDRIGRSLVVNPGPSGQLFDLDALRKSYKRRAKR